jgi:hypothetical protein
LKRDSIKDAAGAVRLNWPTINILVKIKPAKMAGIAFVKSVETKRKIKIFIERRVKILC